MCAATLPHRRRQGSEVNTISEVRTVLDRYPDIRLALLFGSLAKGRARPESDLDLAVGYGRAMRAVDKLALIADLAEALGRPVDLVDLATVGEPLLGEVLAHGMRIIGNDEAYARLLLRHLYDAADFLPYRDRILRERRSAWIGG